ncbi:purine/pyrimidine permease [Indiicoccus explosivorum]|uniref:purine/pyrimidine permease n=1 Tax=Indiicoccus explosivorum TaxID=1917864 RepID=UPI001F4E6CF7|nr:purine/pyrimidine permease [Indiicoccus explosivorum]
MNRQALTATTMETVQWFIFLLASAVALPIVIGAIYHMDFAELAGLMQRTFFIVGTASLLQALFGHRLPIMEGPAGIWISIFSVMAATGLQGGTSLDETLRSLQTLMMLTGLFLFLFGVFKISQRILPIFTPLVTGTFFFLLTVQLSGTFLAGMLGLQGEAETIQPTAALLAFLTFFIVLGLSLFARGWLSSYAVFIGIMAGWAGDLLFRKGGAPEEETALFSAPDLFAFGVPAFSFGMIPTALITAVIIISNVVASIVAVGQTVDSGPADRRMEVDRGTAVSGIGTGLAGMFSSIANVPLSTSAGFIALTGQKARAPFVYASALLILITFFPPVVSLISSIPAPVANAALMATFVQLVGLAINNVSMSPLDSRKMTIVGVAYLLGMGTMFLPPEVFADLPGIMQNLMSNGLLLGTGLVILLEQLWKEKRDPQRTDP